MSKKYTLEIHVKRLREMLEAVEPCDSCPATWDFSSDVESREMWAGEQQDVCTVCANFVEVTELRPIKRCPCHFWGASEAISRSWEAIEKYDKGR